MRVRFVDHYSFTDGDRWITVHPNGKENKGTPVKIDEATGEVKAGMGGKFNGQKISEARKNFIGPRITQSQRKIAQQRQNRENKPTEVGKKKSTQEEALERESNENTWTQIPPEARRLKKPFPISKETEKAYQVETGAGKKWIPKSVSHATQEGLVIGLEDWWARKNGLSNILRDMTRSQFEAIEKQKEAKVKRFDALEKEYLKQNGLAKVKVPFDGEGDSLNYVQIGNQRFEVVERKGWTKVNEGDADKYGQHLKGRERSDAYWAYVKPVKNDETSEPSTNTNEGKQSQRFKNLLDGGRKWERGSVSRTYFSPDSFAEALGLKFTKDKKNRADSVSGEDIDHDFTPASANEFYNALRDIYFDNNRQEFVFPLIFRSWQRKLLKERMQEYLGYLR